MLRTGVVRTRSHSRTSSTTRPKTRGRLPVPNLRQTLDRYLASLEPFLREDESRGGMSYSSAFTLRQKWANEFESGIGKTLQERLLGQWLPYDFLKHFSFSPCFWLNQQPLIRFLHTIG